MRLWVLGSSDPEMTAIEALLRECGEHIEYATVYRDGVRRRVTAGEAYAPDCAIGDGVVGLSRDVYCVECRPAVLYGSSTDGIDWDGAVATIDHHRPGDPGYGRHPEEFLAASSIGQVIAELARSGVLPLEWPRHWTQPEEDRSPGTIAHLPGRHARSFWGVHCSDVAPMAAQAMPCCIAIPRDIVLTAAADHCLGAAYRGQCPGVDPDDLMRWRVESRARFQGRSVEDVLVDVERARVALERARRISLIDRCCGAHVCGDARDPECCETRARSYVRDLRGQHIPELPEASAREGVCFLADGLPGPDASVKVVCQSGTLDQIRAFMEWAPAQGLTDVYGDPHRGFAGGYRREEAIE